MTWKIREINIKGLFIRTRAKWIEYGENHNLLLKSRKEK